MYAVSRYTLLRRCGGRHAGLRVAAPGPSGTSVRLVGHGACGSLECGIQVEMMLNSRQDACMGGIYCMSQVAGTCRSCSRLRKERVKEIIGFLPSTIYFLAGSSKSMPVRMFAPME